MMKKYSLKFFIDFDGTITKNDVWINTIGNFIKDKKKFEEICEDFYLQRIGTREINRRQLELVEDFSIDEFNRSIDIEETDDYFKDFVSYCEENDFEIKIVSGGLDHYIDRILKRENIDLMFYSSVMTWNEEDKKLGCDFIYTDEYCRFCETCKRNILINNTNDLENEISVFIGDGVSDYCVSGFADIVFAKGKLASFCWKNNITYFDYKNFSDVKNKIQKLVSQNKLKHRQEAKVRRKDIFLGG